MNGMEAGLIVALLAVVVAFFVIHPLNGDDVSSNTNSTTSESVRVISQEELSLHDGQKDSTIWLAVLGEVYDVTKGAQYYGQGEGYAGFAGRDATAAFVSGDFTEKGLVDDVSSFTLEQIGGVDHWRKFYRDSANYKKVGVLEGTYFNSKGEPTSERTEAMKKIEQGQKQQDEIAEQKKKHPSCNMRWAQGEGGEVWCEDETQFPRKVAEGENQRCACFSAAEISSGNFKLDRYPDCADKALRCKTP